MRANTKKLKTEFSTSQGDMTTQLQESIASTGKEIKKLRSSLKKAIQKHEQSDKEGSEGVAREEQFPPHNTHRLKNFSNRSGVKSKTIKVRIRSLTGAPFRRMGITYPVEAGEFEIREDSYNTLCHDPWLEVQKVKDEERK